MLLLSRKVSPVTTWLNYTISESGWH